MDYEKLSMDRVGESSEAIRARVQAARNIQTKRYPQRGRGAAPDAAAMTQLNLSARVYHRILKLARTIADLAGSEEVQSVHLAEALQYRPKLMLS